MASETQNLSVFKDNLQSALSCRQQLFPDLPDTELIRLCHEEAPPLRWDKLGQVHWLGWWSSRAPTAEQMGVIKEALENQRVTSWALEWRRNREKAKGAEILHQHNLPETWTASERGQRYLLKSHQGQSRGVFLDQREQRSWVRKGSAGKRVLNLFSYTCGFSVAAALGGAQQVHSVDVSKSYLNWGRENFSLNDLKPEDSKFGFFSWDTLEYLKYAHKKDLKYDLVICDPPSFGRSNKGTFQISKDLPELIRGASQVMAPESEILLTTNYEGWTRGHFNKLLKEWCLPLDLTVDLDFVTTGEDFKSPSPILKGSLLRKSEEL